MEKTKLIYRDERKYQALISERKRFAKELNQGMELLSSLPFVEQPPEQEDLKDPVAWWDKKILEAIAPKMVKGFSPDPRQQALGYSVQYDQHVNDIHRFPWSTISLLDNVNGIFQVTEAIKAQVEKESSTYGTKEQAKVFENLEKMLESLNDFCDRFVSLKADLNALAASIHCKVIQQEDRSHRIVPDYRRLFFIMERGTANL